MKSITNNSRLQEFITTQSTSEWRRIQKLALSNYLSSPKKRYAFRKKSKYFLNLLILNHRQLKRKTRLSFAIFSDCCKCDSKDEKYWPKFTSEILDICYAHIKIINSDKDLEIFSQLKMLDYFSHNGMWKNTDFLKRKDYFEGTIDSSMYSVWRRYAIELELSDIRYKETKKHKLNKLDEWDFWNEIYNKENKLMTLGFKAGIESFLNLPESPNKINYLDQIPEDIKNKPQIELYTLAYQLRINDNDNDFFLLKYKLDSELKKGDTFSAQYLAPLYFILHGHCVKRVRQKKETNKFRELYIKIAINMLNNGLLIEQGKLHKSQLRNIVISYMKLGKQKEALSFVQNYQDLLIGGKTNPIVKYCLAYRYYELGDYKNMYTSLNKIRHKTDLDSYMRIDLKILFLISCIEIKNYKEFKKESIKVLKLIAINKNKISANYIIPWNNTIISLQERYHSNSIKKGS